MRTSILLALTVALAVQSRADEVKWRNENGFLVEVQGYITREKTCPATPTRRTVDIDIGQGETGSQRLNEGEAICWSWSRHGEGTQLGNKNCRAVAGDSIRIDEKVQGSELCREKPTAHASAKVYDSDDYPAPALKPSQVAPKSTRAAVATVAAVHFEKEIAVWRDPLTPPHTATECCQVDEIDHTGIKVCTRYCTNCQWMYVHAVLVVDIASAGNIESEISGCQNDAAAAGLATGIITAALGGGGGALDAAAKAYVAYFTACLQSKITQHIVSVRIDFRSGWGGWEGC